MQYTDKNREMPDDYLQDKGKDVLLTLSRGESCAVIALGSAGKSNFLRHITRSDIKRKHLTTKTEKDKDRADKMLMVLLDPHNLLALEGRALEMCGRSWAGYELMISRLWRTLLRQESQPSGKKVLDFTRSKDSLEAHYNRITQAHPIISQTGVRALENAIYDLIQLDDNLQVVFVMDDIEAFRHRLPDEYFESLRGLRDDFKGRVVYLTTSRSEMEQVVYTPTAHRDTVEAFVELFHGQTFYLDLLGIDEVKTMIGKLITRYGWERLITEAVQDSLAENLYELTRGHAGLIRRAFDPAARYQAYVSRNGETSNLDQLAANLLADAGIYKECLIVLNGLSRGEHQQLHRVLKGEPIGYTYEMYTLGEKHIIDHETGKIKIPLLALRLQANPEILGV